MRDLQDAPEAAWREERSKVEIEGWGRKLLSRQDEDGQWAGGAFVPAGFTPHEWREHGQPWTATCWALTQLREFGLEPACACARRTIDLVGRNSRWDHADEPYWQGETDTCINGRAIADGAYFGADVSAILTRLLSERQEDGGWNCERENGSRVSSFDTTINVLEGLLEYERSVGATPQTRAARRGGEDYLLCRCLFRRRSTGEVADEQYLRLTHPNRWRYDVLRALDYFRDAALTDQTAPDPRLGEAIAIIRSKRLPDGRWALDRSLRGQAWFTIDEGEGKPSAWLTLRALRVLRWWDRGQS
ncbi:squalene cyclase [Labrys neptuniae]